MNNYSYYFHAMAEDPPPACPNGTVYTIRPGDSLFGLAGRFGTSVDAILAANPGINPTNLQLGQQICIPVVPTPGPCPGGFQYFVKPGDTFFSIARRFGIAVPALEAANPGVNPNALRIGQGICIPAAAPPTEECPGRIYTVQPGDTFYGIARRFGYTVDAIFAVNPGVNPNALQVGQTLCLPPSPGGGPFPCYGGSIYIVEPGDTFFSIARRRGIPLSALVAANPQITDFNRLTVGDPVCIPS